MPRRHTTPRLRRRMARLQHEVWTSAHAYGIRSKMPLQLYKCIRRINLPRSVRRA